MFNSINGLFYLSDNSLYIIISFFLSSGTTSF